MGNKLNTVLDYLASRRIVLPKDTTPRNFVSRLETAVYTTVRLSLAGQVRLSMLADPAIVWLSGQDGWEVHQFTRGPRKGMTVERKKVGKSYRYREVGGGKQKAKPEASAGPKQKKAAQPKAAKAEKPTVETTLQSVRDIAAGKGDAGQVAEMLMKHTVKEINEIKSQLGLKASGTKAELAKKIGERLVAQVGQQKPQPEKPPVEQPAPVQPEAGKIDALSLTADNVGSVWQKLRDDIVNYDTSLSPSMAGSLAAARIFNDVRKSARNYIEEIDKRVRDGDSITDDEDDKYVAAQTLYKELYNKVVSISGYRPMGDLDDHPLAQLPISEPLENKAEQKNKIRQELEQKAAATKKSIETGNQEKKKQREVKRKEYEKEEQERQRRQDASQKSFMWFKSQGLSRRPSDVPISEWDSAKRDAVQTALRDGQPIPPEVLADYPDLAAKYGNSEQPKAEAPAQQPAQKPPAKAPKKQPAQGKGKKKAQPKPVSQMNDQEAIEALKSEFGAEVTDGTVAKDTLRTFRGESDDETPRQQKPQSKPFGNMDSKEFGDAAWQAAAAVPANKHPQPGRVFISDAYEAFKQKHGGSLDDFKKALFKAYKDGTIVMSRADIIQEYDPKTVQDSSIKTPYAQFHYIGTPQKRVTGGEQQPAKPAQPAEQPQQTGPTYKSAEGAPPLKSVKATPSQFQGKVKDVYDHLTRLIRYQDGFVAIPELYDYMEREMPGLSTEDFKKQLEHMAWNDKNRTAELHILNEVQNIKDEDRDKYPTTGEGVDETVFGFLLWRNPLEEAQQTGQGKQRAKY